MSKHHECSVNTARRRFCQLAAAGLGLLAAPAVLGSGEAGAATPQGGRHLIAYFSRTGNTRTIAGQIQAAAGGELLELRTVTPYPEDYRATTEQAKKETTPPDPAAYDVIFVGSPNWWGTIAPPVMTFLTSADFSGKTIAPFVTHGGSRLGRAVEDIKKLCPKATVLPGLAVYGESVADAQEITAAWLRRNGLAR